MHTYEIEVYHDRRWWMIRIPELDGLTQARWRGEIKRMARSYARARRRVASASRTQAAAVLYYTFSDDTVARFGDDPLHQGHGLPAGRTSAIPSSSVEEVNACPQFAGN
jgi:hypothetical protein